MENDIKNLEFKKSPRVTVLKMLPAYPVYLLVALVVMIIYKFYGPEGGVSLEEIQSMVTLESKFTSRDIQVLIYAHLAFLGHALLYHFAIIAPYKITFTDGVMRETRDFLGNSDATDFSRMEDIQIRVRIFDFITGLAEVNFLNKETPYKTFRHALSGLARKDAESLKLVLSRNTYSNYTEMVQKSGSEPRRGRVVPTGDGGEQ